MNKKLGYYLVDDGTEFESKIQALIYANTDAKGVSWIFNDAVFNKYDWSVEPELTLDQLYDQRAREIRDQYDYVVLSYSGGSDCNNILESFLRQGLFIDEIITNWALDANEKYIVHDVTEKSSWNNMAEFKLHTSARLDYIKSKSPNTRITFNDTSNLMLSTLLTAGDGSWVETKNDVINLTGANNFNGVHFIEVRKRFDKDKRIAYITGIEKPRIRIIDNKLYIYFIDKAASIAPVNEHLTEYPNAENVFFYWAPECCNLICKQAHSVLKFIKANPQHVQTFENMTYVNIRRIQEILLKNIIYTTWNNNWFQVEKPLSDWGCEFDYWFTKGMAGSKEHSIWLDGVRYLIPRIGIFLNKIDGTIRGTRPFVSKFHYIGNI
jgi:hypothetical protein